jgi:FixJ family two-component response regulator
MSDPYLQRELKRRQLQTQIIFITARRGEAVIRHVLDEGALECLLKPFSDTALLDVLNAAFRPNEF